MTFDGKEPSMVKEVECTTCGRIHPIGESELTFKLPDVVSALSDKDRELRCQASPDIVSLDDERFFIRGLLPLSVAGRERKYNVGVWAEVSIDVFERIYALWNDSEQHQEPRMPGTLANRLPFHSNTLSLPIAVQLTGSKSRPEFYVQAADHSLYGEQLRGIDEHRAIEYSDSAARNAGMEQALAGDARNART